MNINFTRNNLQIPADSSLSKDDYYKFLKSSYNLFRDYPQYLSETENIHVLELSHLLPMISETLLSIYIGINDVVCNKGLITPFLPRHAHNNVFVFDQEIFAGDNDVPSGTVDVKKIINGFLPPNKSWNPKWTYVMIKDTSRNYSSLWLEKGYIDMIPAKFEDFTLLSDHNKSKVCFFIDPEAFGHPVNKDRIYLKKARDRGEKLAGDFKIPELIKDETNKLAPVILNRGEKLYVARIDFQPCDHCWSNIHPENEQLAVVNENSAVPLNLVISKPPVKKRYSDNLFPPLGSTDFTTDWFYRGKELFRKPIIAGHISG